MPDKLVYIECRCKDCVYAEARGDPPNTRDGLWLCNNFHRLVTGYFFCKCAERRDRDGKTDN